jgi:hypothetical protein
VEQAPASLGRLERSARVLLGWLSDQQTQHLLSGQRAGVQLTPEQLAQAEDARSAVALRSPGIDQAETLGPVPLELEDHIAALREGPGAGFFAEGWQVAVVDLRTVCAFQPTVFVDTAVERTADLKPGEWEAIAALTLPTSAETELQPQFAQDRQAWVISSPNPNLRVVGPYGTAVNGAPGPSLGFIVTVMPSFLQVASVNGRHLLRDGYHRAIGLLANGITHVPAFVRDFGPFPQHVVPPNMLDQPAYLGGRPPTLADYWNDEVTVSVQLPASHKMVLIQALELNVMG